MTDAISSILSRRSNRGFSEKPLSDEQIVTLKQCALASPSAINLQPWHFSFVNNAAVISEVESEVVRLIMQGQDEAAIARMKSRQNSIFYGAPTVVFISGDRTKNWHAIDAGIAVENLAIAAQALGLGSVIIGMCKLAFDGENGAELARKCAFPEGYDFEIAIAIGHPTVSKEAHPVGENKLTVID